jgi:hypothetical protein
MAKRRTPELAAAARPNIIHMTSHAIGVRPPMRVWTDADVPYGTFRVASWEDASLLIALAHKHDLATIMLHTHDDARAVSYGETLPEMMFS